MAYNFGPNTGQWQTLDQAGGGAENVDINQLLKSLGWSSPDGSISNIVPGSGGSGDSGGDIAPTYQGTVGTGGMTADQFLASKGLTLRTQINPNATQFEQAFDANGNPVGTQITGQDDPENAFLAGILGIGGFGAAAALGAGAGAAGGATEGGGLSSSDLSSLYSNAGYGSTGADVPGVSGSFGGAVGGVSGADPYAGFASGSVPTSEVPSTATWGSGTFGTPANDVGGLTSLDSSAYAGSGDSFLPTGSSTGSNLLSSAKSALGSNSWANSAGNALGFGNVGDSLGLSNGGILKLAGTLGSGLISSNAAGNALNAQTNATNAANATQLAQYNQSRADWAPYRAAGTQALGNMTNLLNNPSSVLSDPGVAFQQQQGQMGLDRQANAAGGLYSGAQLKGASRYNQNFASTALDAALARYGNVAQIGATGTQSTQNAGTNYANQTSANDTNLGNAGAGSALYSGNVWGNALNSLVGNSVATPKATTGDPSTSPYNPYNLSTYGKGP